MRLIDADSLKRLVEEEWFDCKEKSSFFDEIDRTPTIEPKHGKWMAIGNTGLAACKCGYITDRYSIYNYCPNCGARMSNECAD